MLSKLKKLRELPTRAYVEIDNRTAGLVAFATAGSALSSNSQAAAAKGIGSMGEAGAQQTGGILTLAQNGAALVGFILVCVGLFNIYNKDKSNTPGGKIAAQILVGTCLMMPMIIIRIMAASVGQESGADGGVDSGFTNASGS